MSSGLRSESAHEPSGPAVLLVEDEQSIAEPFAKALTRGGFPTTVARTGAEAIELEAALHPDVVLLDLALPDGDGRDVCRRMRRDSDVPIIIVTASGTVTDRVVGLELGADDYVVKPFAVGEVIARIRAVLRRGRGGTSGSDTLVAQSLRIDVGARRAWLGERELELTRKEFDLLVRLAREPDRVVTRESLMSDVWDMNWFGSTKTLDVHIAWLRRKLGDDPSRAEVHPHRARHRLPPGHYRGVRPVTLRIRLLAALTYVLLLAIIALGVPLAINLQRAGQRRGAHSGAGAGRSGRRDGGGPARTPRKSGAGHAGSHGRRIDPRPRPRRERARHRARRQRHATSGGRELREPAGDPHRAPGRQVQVPRDSKTLGQEILATAVPIVRNRRPAGAVRVTQSVAAVHSAVRRAELGTGADRPDRARARPARRGGYCRPGRSQPLRRLEAVARRVARGRPECAG